MGVFSLRPGLEGSGSGRPRPTRQAENESPPPPRTLMAEGSMWAERPEFLSGETRDLSGGSGFNPVPGRRVSSSGAALLMGRTHPTRFGCRAGWVTCGCSSDGRAAGTKAGGTRTTQQGAGSIPVTRGTCRMDARQGQTYPAAGGWVSAPAAARPKGRPLPRGSESQAGGRCMRPQVRRWAYAPSKAPVRARRAAPDKA